MHICLKHGKSIQHNKHTALSTLLEPINTMYMSACTCTCANSVENIQVHVLPTGGLALALHDCVCTDVMSPHPFLHPRETHFQLYHISSLLVMSVTINLSIISPHPEHSHLLLVGPALSPHQSCHTQQLRLEVSFPTGYQ